MTNIRFTTISESSHKDRQIARALEEQGIPSTLIVEDVPTVAVADLHIARWIRKSVVALSEQPELLCHFLQVQSFKTDVGRFIKELEQDPDMVYAVSRAFELSLKTEPNSEPNVIRFSVQMKDDFFQLDKEAAIAFAKWTEKNSDFAYTQIMKLDKLPAKYAEILYKKYEHRVTDSVVLTSKRFSDDFLKTEARIALDRWANPVVLLSNPFLSTTQFKTLASQWNAFNATLMKEMDFPTLERWEIAIDRVIEKMGNTNHSPALSGFLANPSIPSEMINYIHERVPEQRFHPTRDYAAIELLASKEGDFGKVSHDSPWSIINHLETPEHADSFYRDVSDPYLTKRLLGAPITSRSLFARLIVENSEKDFSNAPILITIDYLEDNPWKVEADYYLYRTLWDTPEEKLAYENRLDALLASAGLEGIEQAPVSWRVHMLDYVKDYDMEQVLANAENLE